jgi:hypothetical protein
MKPDYEDMTDDRHKNIEGECFFCLYGLNYEYIKWSILDAFIFSKIKLILQHYDFIYLLLLYIICQIFHYKHPQHFR